jgi:hypothetical protein
MKAEEKVKQVWPQAFCYRMYAGAYYIIKREGAKGKIGGGQRSSEAWADAWRRIQCERSKSK